MSGKRGEWIFLRVVLTVMVITIIQDYARAIEPNLVEKGKGVYYKYCVGCHGEKGDGKGVIGFIHRAQKNGVVVTTYPRDFTAGLFKFRSTLTGELPTDEDLLKTIGRGIPRSGMPSHSWLPIEERKAVIAYIKSFSPRWTGATPGQPIKIAMPQWVGSKDSVAKGEKLWQDAECWSCHGKEGQGNGPSAPTLKDNWGDRILPFDFTSGALKGGDKTEDIYRTFVTGLDGTPMPSYGDSLEEEERWHLVSYTLKLMGKAGN